jgi:hypothetical protein
MTNQVIESIWQRDGGKHTERRCLFANQRGEDGECAIILSASPKVNQNSSL